MQGTAINKTQKGITKALYSGAISASVTEANSTVIDMQGFTSGSLEVVENSGTGSWSFALYECSATGGTYTPGLIAAGTARTFAIPDGGGTIDINDLRANFIKLVPTLTGTSNITVKFTPSP
jgi:hypothetical protein